MDEVCVEAMTERDAGDRSAVLDALLNKQGFKVLGIGTACWLNEIPA